MATYAISDIHGEYEHYMRLLERIRFSEEDTLYVLGDVLDRGPHPIKVLQEMMKCPNVIPIAGNHEAMGTACLRFLQEEITEESIAFISMDLVNQLLDWQRNGSVTTIDEFHKLDPDARADIISYIENFSAYEEVAVNDKSYVLVHAGFQNFSPVRPLCDYSLDELVWERPDYEKPYFEDKYVVTGHTPTQIIGSNPRPGYIYRANNHIAIDCGAFYGGRLGAICLETGEEFYSTR